MGPLWLHELVAFRRRGVAEVPRVRVERNKLCLGSLGSVQAFVEFRFYFCFLGIGDIILVGWLRDIIGG